MRPTTLADAVDRIRAGAPRDAVLAEFVDMFDLIQSRRRALCIDRAGTAVDR